MTCKILFGKHYDYCYSEVQAELEITDKIEVKKIIDLGFERDDLQSLFQENEIEYLTSYPIYFREIEYKGCEYKNKKEAIELVLQLCKDKDFIVSEEINFFDFSFPKTEFEKLAKKILNF